MTEDIQNTQDRISHKKEAIKRNVRKFSDAKENGTLDAIGRPLINRYQAIIDRLNRELEIYELQINHIEKGEIHGLKRKS